MDFKQSNIQEILDSEREMVMQGPERYGQLFVHASEMNELLNDFIVSVDPDRFIFAMFLSQVRKHATLAHFSTIRLHHLQAMMDLRQALEAGACAAYAIANTDAHDFADSEDGLLNPSQELAKKRYDWLAQNYPAGSKAIHDIKRSINSSGAHANIVFAHNNFNFNGDDGRFETPFFDFENRFMVETDLWSVANASMGLMDFFWGVNQDRNVIKFRDDFLPRLRVLSEQDRKMRLEIPCRKVAADLEKYLDLTGIGEDGEVYEEIRKKRVDTVGDLIIHVYSDHNPPHFHVISKQRNIDARFKLDDCEFISDKGGQISAGDIKKIKSFYSQYPERFETLKNAHAQMNPKKN